MDSVIIVAKNCKKNFKKSCAKAYRAQAAVFHGDLGDRPDPPLSGAGFKTEVFRPNGRSVERRRRGIVRSLANSGGEIRGPRLFDVDARRLLANDAFGEIIRDVAPDGAGGEFSGGVLSMNRMFMVRVQFIKEQEAFHEPNVHGPCAVHKGTGGYKYSGSYGARGTNADGNMPDDDVVFVARE
jgi:hypothetical protein